DRQPKLTLSRPQPAAETARPHLNPRKRPQIAGYSSETGKHRFASDCVVVDAVRCEPVSASNFPDNREINREFAKFSRMRRFPSPIGMYIQKLPAEFPARLNRELF